MVIFTYASLSVIIVVNIIITQYSKGAEKELHNIAIAADPTCPFLIPSDLPFSQVRVLLSELNLVRWGDMA